MAEVVKDTVPDWMYVRRTIGVEEIDGEINFLMNGEMSSITQADNSVSRASGGDGRRG